MKPQRLALLDSDLRRRAVLFRDLSEMQIHVEPYESTAEIFSHWVQADAILVHDDPGVVAEVANFICAKDVRLPVLAFAESLVAEQIVHAVQEGASDYLVLPISIPVLKRSLTQAQSQSCRSISRQNQEGFARNLISQLTRREFQILECMANGMLNWEIGESLDISRRTVEVHRANLLKRLGVRHSTEAIRIAIEAGLDGLRPIQECVSPSLPSCGEARD